MGSFTTSENNPRSVMPPGVRYIRKLVRREISYESYKLSVLLLTFVAYALYHTARKPTSIVKSVLDSQTLNSANRVDEESPFPWPLHIIFVRRSKATDYQNQLITQFSSHSINNLTAPGDSITEIARSGVLKGWPPFTGDSGTARLGQVDVAFLAFYALGMYFAGHLGDRVCLRWFLAIGMVGTGIFVSLFGIAYWCNIHYFYYFILVQAVAGLFQATGWPSVVTIVANWFGKRKRGLIMGIWNAHTSVGNICGSLIAAGVLSYGWGWSFVVPGALIAAGGILVFFFLVVDPKVVGWPSPYECKDGNAFEGKEEFSKKGVDYEKAAISFDAKTELEGKLKEDERTTPLLTDEEAGHGYEENAVASSGEDSPVGFFKAWTIPGVAPFALCLFFGKLVAYTFLYWLPFYIRHTEIQGEYLSDNTSGNLSTLFDVGGVVGGILAGHLSDKMGARAIIAASFMYGAIPALFFYRVYGHISLWLNLILLVLAGMFVNGPYALITTAVSADLGTHESLKGNSRALATVTAIIDGTGSVGAAIGPLITGYISASSWNAVFTLLMVSALISGLLLTRLVVAEMKEKIQRPGSNASRSSGQQDLGCV